MNDYLPYDVIEKAVSGDTGAICTVLKHFDRIIYRLSLVPVLSLDGVNRFRCDEDIRQELQVELITRLPGFDAVNG